MSDRNYLLNAALDLVAIGVPVFPVNPQNKTPLLARKKDANGRDIPRTGGIYKASTDARKIKAWWGRWPGALIGVPTGRPETFNVLDIDAHAGKPNGYLSIPEWESLSTKIAKTRSGGAHLYFRPDPEILNVASRIAPGIDARSLGGFVIVPPSPGYTWHMGADVAFADLPSWPEAYRPASILRGNAERKPGMPEKPIEWVRAAVGHIPNEDLGWDDWNALGMAIWRATGGSGDGYEVFDDFSQKSGKYLSHETAERWEQYYSSPPNSIGYGTLEHKATRTFGSTAWKDALRQADDEFETIDATASPPTQPAEEDHLIFRTASDIPMEAIDWFWPDRFAKGKIGLLAGLPDMGKGCLCAYLAAAATANKPLPCGEGYAPQGHVIWFNAEDTVTDTVRPRLAAAGADCAKVHFIEGSHVRGKQRTPNLLTDVPLLRKTINHFGNVQLLIFDPLSAYFGCGKVDARSGIDVRSSLEPLKRLAEETGISIVAILHFNKNADMTNALLRVSDSIAYTAVARHAFVVVPDPDEPQHRRLFCKAKNNLARSDVKSLAYTFGYNTAVGYSAKLMKDIGAPYIIWSDEAVDTTANDALASLNSGDKGQALREAVTFLQDKLKAEALSAESVTAESALAGIAERTLRRAKQKLKITSRKVDGRWVWALPGADAALDFGLID